jgi:hypothetical protein
LRFLLQARKAKEQGEDEDALRYYEMALPFFPGQVKLLSKIDKLRAKISGQKSEMQAVPGHEADAGPERGAVVGRPRDEHDGEYQHAEADVDDESFVDKPSRGKGLQKKQKGSNKSARAAANFGGEDPVTPRARHLLDIVNSRDLALIKSLHGFGTKKAQDLIDRLGHVEDDTSSGIESLAQLKALPGIGSRTVERAYEGLTTAVV